MRLPAIIGSLVLVSACTPPEDGEVVYTPPEESSLVSIRPYPTSVDVCKVIGENERTVEYLDDSATLVGCPLGENGAIADRRREGGKVVGQVGAWVLLSIPDA